jgi:L-threonylcarbamoyladenylate synthase
MPTETVYGFAARVDSALDISSIFRLKQRPSVVPLIVHVADFGQAETLVAEWSPLARDLVENFWLGPLVANNW